MYQPVICFYSDFGLDDAWVGVCHATIHRSSPQVRVVDMTHQVPPYDIWKGAAVATSGVWQLPTAIHMVVVDPGVGGGRNDLCLVTGTGTRLIGPDNGVLLPPADCMGGVAEAYVIDPRLLGAAPPLATFLARDVMAPAAAALASGVDASSLGSQVDPAILRPAPFEQARREGDHVAAMVVDVEHFGSVRLTVRSDRLRDLGLDAPRLQMTVGHHSIEAPLARTFSDVERKEPVFIFDSSGWLTLAVREGRAAERYDLEVGRSVLLQSCEG